MIKVCSCNRRYCTLKQWERLGYVGIHKDERPYPDLELRNCACGSTIAVAIPTAEFFAAKIDTTKRGSA